MTTTTTMNGTSGTTSSAVATAQDNHSSTSEMNHANPPEPVLLQTPKKKLTSLTLVSMNVANCEPSAEAPKSWTTQEVTQAIQHELLQSQPDILALQECPSLDWAASAFEEHGYRVVGHRGAHAGYVALLVLDTLPKEYGVVVENLSTTEYRKLPAVVASLHIPLSNNSNNNDNDNNNQSTTLFIASVHLAPFRGGNWDRRAQMESLLELARPHALIVAGDTNMREEEDSVMEDELGLLDAWKQAGSHPSTKFTWDTRNHLQNATAATLSGRIHNTLQGLVGGAAASPSTMAQTTTTDTDTNEEGYFNRYYGSSTREYATRYDRIYISLAHKDDNQQQHQTSVRARNNEKVNAAKVEVDYFGLIANKPVTPPSRTHFLSDHFGITCTFKIDV